MESCSAPEPFSKAGFDFLEPAPPNGSDHHRIGSTDSRDHEDLILSSNQVAIPCGPSESQPGKPHHQTMATPQIGSNGDPIASTPRKSIGGYSVPSPKYGTPSSPGIRSVFAPLAQDSPQSAPSRENFKPQLPPMPTVTKYPLLLNDNFVGHAPGVHANNRVAPQESLRNLQPSAGSPVGSPARPMRSNGPDSWSAPPPPQFSMGPSHPGSSHDIPPAPPSMDVDRSSNAASPIGGAPTLSNKKTCAKCGGPISGQFVRALGTAFHLDCFTCGDCGDPCAAKFFPVDIKSRSHDSPTQIPLCERCYFKRLDLLCYRCGDALRGSYITALDRKYHVEHFTCSLCSTIFGPEDSYYEHENDVFCHYHYSTLHAARCEGCRAAILKQFVETYRGGREQQWHPECYMIFKFWNVKLAGTSAVSKGEDLLPLPKEGDVPKEVCLEVLSRERDIEGLVAAIWTTLCSFEEISAGHVSNMVQYAVQMSCNKALESTKLLVERVQILFDALDTLPPEPREDKRLSKEPKTLCRKIVSYMSTLSKIRQGKTGAMSNDLLTVASSIAHYLKVLIRFGLASSLAHNRDDNSRAVLDNFLTAMTAQQPAVKFPVTALTSDKCASCDQTVEDVCIRYSDKLWHTGCLACSRCGRSLTEALPEAQYTQDGAVVCTNCERIPQRGSSNFIHVTRLGQYMFLLSIALSRLELVLSQHDSRDTSHNASLSTPSLSQPKSPLTPLELKQRSSSGEDVSTAKNVLSMVGSSGSPYLHSKKGDVKDLSPMIGALAQKSSENTPALQRTSHLLQSKVSLTLDDIRRIVAAEQAREQMPNAYRHRTGLDTAASEWLRSPQGRIKGTQPEVSYFGKLNSDDYTLVQHIAGVRLLVEYPSVQFGELADFIGRKNSSFWSKMGKAFGANKKKTPCGVFGAPLDILIERNGADSSMGVGDYTLRIPSFVDDCVSAMRQKDLSVEGVFRKNGNIRRIREFVETVDKNPDLTSTLADEQPIQLAALLKRFLRDMPEPLMGAKLTKLWVQVTSLEEEQQVPYLRLVVCLLSKSQRDLLEVLTYFLNWAASFAHLDEEAGSKMDAQNLATVITPNIMHAKEEDGADVHFQAIKAVSILIEQHMIVAEIPPEVERLLAQVKERRKEKMSTRELTELIREVAGGDQLPGAVDDAKVQSGSARSGES